MKMNKLLAVLLAFLLMAGGAFADDFDFDDDFGADAFGSDDFSFDDFGFGDFGGSGDSSCPVNVSGAVSADVRAYISGNEDTPADCAVAGGFDTDLTVSYSGTNADATVVFNLNSDTLNNNLEGLVDEAYATAYFGNLKLDAGKMKTVWGKGDKLHVIDNFNADDYTDFIIPDYFDRRVATPMVKASYAFDYAGDVLSNVKIEGVYTPFLPTDRFATSGVWTPAQVTALTGVVTGAAEAKLADVVGKLEKIRLFAATGNATEAIANGYFTSAEVAALASQLIASGQASDATTAQTKAATLLFSKAIGEADTAYIQALNSASALANDPSLIYPDTTSLKYSQAGVRLTGSLGPVDLGLSYYYGHSKQPVMDATKLDSWLTKYLSGAATTNDDAFLFYDQKQTFGAEMATILWHFNVRGEGCYNLMDKTDDSVQWLGGFDIDLPFWNMNINVQETGTCVLADDSDMNNKIAANLSASFKNEKICPEATVMYGIEKGDVVVLPKVTFNPNGEVALTVSGMYDWCKDEESEFYAWKDNNFIQVGAKVTF